MRIRSVKPEFWNDDITGEMPADVALLYLGICCLCDDAGRFRWDERIIRSQLDPFGKKFNGDEGVGLLLESLRARKRVFWYSVRGTSYGVMPSFKNHQRPQKPSVKYPPPPPGTVRDQYDTNPVPVEDVGEGRGEGEEGGGSATSESTGTSRGQVLPLPAKGAR